MIDKPAWKLTELEKVDLIAEYLSGEPTTKLSIKYKISPAAICGILDRRNIPRRSLSDAKRIHTLNEKAFSEITEESAYWIGFIMADGTVIRTPRQSPEIAIVLQERDIKHLEKFRNFLSSSHTISSSKRGERGYVRIAFRSKIIADDLERYGIVPRKTKIAKIKYLENNRHFWRGLIDGDGSIGWSQPGKPCLDLAGSKSMIEQFILYTKTVIPHLTLNSRQQHPGCYKTHISWNTAAIMIQTLYSDCSVSLDRKQERANKIISESLHLT